MGTECRKASRAKMLMAGVFAAFATFVLAASLAGRAYAEETEIDVTYQGCVYHAWMYEGKAGSVQLREYTGDDTQVIIPGSFVVDGVTYPSSGGIQIGSPAFQGNEKITKVAIEPGFEIIGDGAFASCTALTEIAVGAPSEEYSSIGLGAFADCPNLKTYRFSIGEIAYLGDCKIGQDGEGNIYPGVTVYAIAGSAIANYVDQVNADAKAKDPNANQITLITTEADPYSKHTVKPATSGDNSGSGDNGDGNNDTPLTIDPKKQMGEDGTAYGAGAAAEAVDAALIKYKAESDPKGTVFGLIQAKVKKVTKSAITLTWKKPAGAKKFVIYGNKCGKTNKQVKLATTTKTTYKFNKKLNKKITIKKGTYYKFTIVALDKNKKVVSTSKIIHVATPGGKYTNDKKVTTAAKSNKVTLKKGKTFKLKAKAVAIDKSMKRASHRKVAYESSNKTIATVDKKGVIKAKKKGSCYVYAYAQNGVFAKVKVTVK